MKIKNGNFFFFFPKPNQKFQKVFLANQKIWKKKKKTSFPLFPLLVLLHPKPSTIHNINNPLYQNNISNWTKEFLIERTWIFFLIGIYLIDGFFNLMFSNQEICFTSASDVIIWMKRIHPSFIFEWCSRWMDIGINWMFKFIIWYLGCSLILFGLMGFKSINQGIKSGKGKYI